MKIFNSIRIILLLLNICMVMYIILLTEQELWVNGSNKESTFNTSKALNKTKIAR